MTASDGSTNHLIIHTLQLPRSLIAILVGAIMAIAGAIMQGLTCNPLAATLVSWELMLVQHLLWLRSPISKIAAGTP